MNIAVIFAGGLGRRMNSQAKPKQFLNLHGKPVLVHTLEHFQSHSEIDGIVLVCLEEWLGRCAELIRQYELSKVAAVLPGGETGQASIYAGLRMADKLYGGVNTVVLLHDGVRPMIDEDTITRAIASVRAHGSAITVSPAEETVTCLGADGRVEDILDRDRCFVARAPQGFFLKDILSAHRRAAAEGKTNFIDSASLMQHYGCRLYTVPGPAENIKITTPTDFFLFRAIMDARENSQIEEL